VQETNQRAARLGQRPAINESPGFSQDGTTNYRIAVTRVTLREGESNGAEPHMFRCPCRNHRVSRNPSRRELTEIARPDLCAPGITSAITSAKYHNQTESGQMGPSMLLWAFVWIS